MDVELLVYPQQMNSPNERTEGVQYQQIKVRVNVESKSQICKAGEPHETAASLLPTTWRSTSAQSRRRQVRRR
eukprot:4585663-Pleurochrysis_carterae.AAC.1